MNDNNKNFVISSQTAFTDNSQQHSLFDYKYAKGQQKLENKSRKRYSQEQTLCTDSVVIYVSNNLVLHLDWGDNLAYQLRRKFVS